MCPFCHPQVVGWDIPNPFSYAYDLGKSIGSGDAAPDLPTPDVSNIPGPYSLGKSLGTDVQNQASTSILKPFSDFTTSVKWMMIAGAGLAGVVILYSVYQAWKKDLPGRSLEAFKRSEDQKVALASKYASGR
jgi:hypothetical protein